MSEALEAYYGVMVGEGRGAAKKPVHGAIAEAKGARAEKLDSLQSSLRDEAALEHLRQSGELLLAYQYALTPGQTICGRSTRSMGRAEIAIDPALTPLENAQHYFEQYDKAKRARAGVPHWSKPPRASIS